MLISAGLVSTWMGDRRQADKLSRYDSTAPPKSAQPGHPSVGRRNEYQRKLGLKQAHRAMH